MMDEIIEKTKVLQKKADYADQYVDSIEFMLIGVAFGVFGGIWGNVILDYLHSYFGEYYILVLVVITLVLLYFLSFPVRRARKMVDENMNSLDELVAETEGYRKKIESARDPSESESKR